MLDNVPAADPLVAIVTELWDERFTTELVVVLDETIPAVYFYMDNPPVWKPRIAIYKLHGLRRCGNKYRYVLDRIETL